MISYSSNFIRKCIESYYTNISKIERSDILRNLVYFLFLFVFSYVFLIAIVPFLFHSLLLGALIFSYSFLGSLLCSIYKYSYIAVPADRSLFNGDDDNDAGIVGPPQVPSFYIGDGDDDDVEAVQDVADDHEFGPTYNLMAEEDKIVADPTGDDLYGYTDKLNYKSIDTEIMTNLRYRNLENKNYIQLGRQTLPTKISIIENRF